MKRLVLLSIVIALAGCKANNPNQANGTQSNTLRYTMSADPTTLDPALAQDLITGDMIAQVYEGLVTLGEDNKIHPLLAEKWEITDGGKTYIFHIKKDVKFSNGSPLTASDFKWTYERNCSPALGAALAQDYLGDILGAKDKIKGTANDIKGLVVVDEHTLKITLDAPRPYFLGKLAYGVADVICKDVNPKGEAIRSPAMAIGTGPFVLKSYDPHAAVNLVANKSYHAGAPKIDGIYMAIVKDPSTAMTKYRAGQLDFLTIQPQDVNTILKDPALKDQAKPYDRPGLIYVGLNGAAYEPFKNRDVRRAFAMAIDRNKIADEILANTKTFATDILPPALPGHRDNAPVIPYDPAGAKALLQKAGYDGAKMPEIDILMSQRSPEYRVVCDAVVTMLRENLGVNAKVQPLEWAAFLQRTNKRLAGMFLGSWYADYLDPENFLSLTLASYGQNRVAYDNPEFTNLCKQADSLMDEAKRIQLYQQADDLVLQDAVWVPMYFAKEFTLVRPGVSGIRSNVFGFMPHATTTLK